MSLLLVRDGKKLGVFMLLEESEAPLSRGIIHLRGRLISTEPLDMDRAYSLHLPGKGDEIGELYASFVFPSSGTWYSFEDGTYVVDNAHFRGTYA